MYTYEIKTGNLISDSGVTIGVGIAGNGIGLNNPDMCDTEDVGPLPSGKYKIGSAYNHPRLGPVTMDLIPDPSNEMFGRSLFRIHGLRIGTTFENPGTSSDGCMCQELEARTFVARNQAVEDELLVVRGD
jgi:hypothetical protein